MSKASSKYIDFGTGTNQVNSKKIPADFTPTNYTPAQVASEGADKVSSHLKGIDEALGASGSGIGKYTSTQALAANWVSDGSQYKQTITLPGSLTMGSCIIQVYVSTTYDLITPELKKGASNTQFDIWTNDNSVTYNFVIIG